MRYCRPVSERGLPLGGTPAFAPTFVNHILTRAAVAPGMKARDD